MFVHPLKSALLVAKSAKHVKCDESAAKKTAELVSKMCVSHQGGWAWHVLVRHHVYTVDPVWISLHSVVESIDFSFANLFFLSPLYTYMWQLECTLCVHELHDHPACTVYLPPVVVLCPPKRWLSGEERRRCQRTRTPGTDRRRTTTQVSTLWAVSIPVQTCACALGCMWETSSWVLPSVGICTAFTVCKKCFILSKMNSRCLKDNFTKVLQMVTLSSRCSTLQYSCFSVKLERSLSSRCLTNPNAFGRHHMYHMRINTSWTGVLKLIEQPMVTKQCN